MNQEQLNSARLVRWSQDGNAKLTLESASEWLANMGLCGFLPSRHGTAVAASFLEAVVGRPAPNPSSNEHTRAHEMLARLIENAAAVPLKTGPATGEQPDLVVGPETFRYIYALCGNRNFKGVPPITGNDKVTPLALHCWQALERQGPADIGTLQTVLGQETTEAALLRALHELWTHLYVFPSMAGDGSPTKWELTFRVFPAQVAAGACTAHAEAHSALISLYLHSVIAAPEEEILAILAPFAPYSKLREVIHGLGSMRQLDMVDVSGRPHLSLQGEPVPEVPVQAEAQPDLHEGPRAETRHDFNMWERPRANAPHATRPPREINTGGRMSAGSHFPKKKFVSWQSGSEQHERVFQKRSFGPSSSPEVGNERQERRENSRGRGGFRSGGFKPPMRRGTPRSEEDQREARPRKKDGVPFYQNRGPRRDVKEDRPRTGTKRAGEKQASNTGWGKQSSEFSRARRKEPFGASEQRPWKTKQRGPENSRGSDWVRRGKPRSPQERPSGGRKPRAASFGTRTDGQRRPGRFANSKQEGTSNRSFRERRASKAPLKTASAENRPFRGERTSRPQRPAGEWKRKPFGAGNSSKRPSGKTPFRRNDKRKPSSNRGKS